LILSTGVYIGAIVEIRVPTLQMNQNQLLREVNPYPVLRVTLGQLARPVLQDLLVPPDLKAPQVKKVSKANEVVSGPPLP